MEKKPTSLANQMARIIVGKTEITITFGPDVWLTWESGAQAPSNEQPETHPEIKGNVKAEKGEDYSSIQDAELVLDDKRVFKITFFNKTYFTANQSINSRTRVLS